MSRRRLSPLLLGALLTCVAALATACGSSSTSSSSTATAGPAASAGATVTPSGTTTTRTHLHSHDTVGPTAVHKPYPGTGGDEPNDDNPGGADIEAKQAKPGTLNPCALVTRQQAEAILAEPVSAPQYGPLGPTCIYQPRRSKNFITISLAPGGASVIGHLQKRTVVKAAGHTAYCGVYGEQLVLVPVAHGHTLSVSAPCTVGTKLASAAIAKLPA
ncbi:MAG TPA: hypothetical protein VLZ06_08370 [Solirubrobacteraceae bacterium]|nr:hypothetical protein [Solirubrobacteraceae bacterium]